MPSGSGGGGQSASMGCGGALGGNGGRSGSDGKCGLDGGGCAGGEAGPGTRGASGAWRSTQARTHGQFTYTRGRGWIGESGWSNDSVGVEG